MVQSSIIKRKNFLVLLVYIAVLATSLSGIVISQQNHLDDIRKDLDSTLDRYQAEKNREQMEMGVFSYIPRLGFDNVLADWIYLKFVQYFGDTEVRDSIGYSLCPDYFENVITKDPRFTDAINTLEVCTSIFAGDPVQSINNLEASLKQIQPKMSGIQLRPYYIWRSLGINQLLFLGKSSKTVESYQKAIDWAQDYQDEDSQRFIANLQESVDYLAKNPNSTMAQIGAWVNVLNTNPDEKTFKRVVQEIKSLGGTVEISSDGQLKVTLPKNTD